ncbi:50S ribosomal protein L30e-like protein [Podospora australis]|uniref:H/ACA ribonucleoprotein complex subunit 2 n=1 Tax=Podospora australis TaxID=1536484 RepID=A0AAN7ALG4_9PEZI|nr:50S ribosomal protein L30e-like protein [Podospora australis]
MAAEDKIDIVDKKSKKDKKSKDKSEKKEKKHSESGGISKEKKDKKKDKAKQEKLAHALDQHIQAEASNATALVVADKPEDIEVDVEEIIKTAEDLVPFALPLADEKASKKAFKLIKKAAKLKSLHRGVKEVEKALKKCPIKTPASNITDVPGLVVIAGDISPMEVIMHFPILCEEHNVPYLFVKSRAELGVAASTKRATSIVMLKPASKKDSKKDDDKDLLEEYLSSYKDLIKIAHKEWEAQVHPWVKGTHPLQVQAREQARLAAL